MTTLAASRISARSLGKMPTTSVRRPISRLTVERDHFAIAGLVHAVGEHQRRCCSSAPRTATRSKRQSWRMRGSLFLTRRHRPVIDVQRVDYIRVPGTDMQKANHRYGEVLGLERNPNSPDEDWVEYETGT
jgi:hypothetical protein